MKNFSYDKVSGGVMIIPDFFGEEVRCSDLESANLAKFADYGIRCRMTKQRVCNPLTDAPILEPAGGHLMFGNDFTFVDLATIATMTGLRPIKEFAIYMNKSDNPKNDGYIAQLRIVSAFALRAYFEEISRNEMNNFPRQEMDVMNLIWKFVEGERKVWNAKRPSDINRAVVREELGFGFAVENSHYGIYRLWSRIYDFEEGIKYIE